MPPLLLQLKKVGVLPPILKQGIFSLYPFTVKGYSFFKPDFCGTTMIILLNTKAEKSSCSLGQKLSMCA